MEATNLRFGDKLEGASNIIPWKVRVSLILMENGMWEFVDNKLTPPKNVAKLVAYNQKDENYLRCGEGSCDYSPIREEYNKGDVRYIDKAILE